MDPDGPCSSSYNPNALVRIGVLHGAILCYSSCILGNAPVQVREEGDRYEALPYTMYLQPADEGI